MEIEEEERVGGETMDDVIRTAKEVSSLLKAHGLIFSPPSLKNSWTMDMLTSP